MNVPNAVKVQSYQSLLELIMAFLCAGMFLIPQNLIAKSPYKPLKRSLEEKLMNAVAIEDLDAMKLLVEKGANINTQDESGRTPLMWSVRYQNQEMFDYMMLQGADLHIVDHGKWNALMLAVLQENEVMVQKLIKAGNDLNAKDKNGSTALMMARFKQNHRIERLIQNAIHQQNTPPKSP